MSVKTQVFNVKSIEVATKVFDKATVSSPEFTLFELLVRTKDGEKVTISLYADGVVELFDVLTMKPTYVESEG